MKPLRADITLRIVNGEIVATVSDGLETSIHREPRPGDQVAEAPDGGDKVPEAPEGEAEGEADREPGAE